MSWITAETIARTLGLRRVGRGWRGPCPLHGGSSFTLHEDGGKVLFTCWSGCDRAALLHELKRRGIWPEADWTPAERRDFAKQRARDEADLGDARMFADVAHILAAQCLEDMGPFDTERAPLTRLLAALRTETGALAEFRAGRDRAPEMTAALVRAGSAHRRRVAIMLEDYLEVRRNAA